MSDRSIFSPFSEVLVPFFIKRPKSNLIQEFLISNVNVEENIPGRLF